MSSHEACSIILFQLFSISSLLTHRVFFNFIAEIFHIILVSSLNANESIFASTTS
jgi:hypothetical protein